METEGFFVDMGGAPVIKGAFFMMKGVLKACA